MILYTTSVQSVHAAALTVVSDVVQSSAIGTSTSHTIQFTATNAIPVSGKIRITPHEGAFTIPSGFDFTDVDVAVSSGGPFTERTLAASASLTEDGVAVVTGTSGSITITLNSSAGISAGNTVRIRLGTNAIEGATGNVSLVNPATPGSYRMKLATLNASSGSIDDSQTRIAVLEPVTASVTPTEVVPVRTNGLPSGPLSHGNASIEISLNTSDFATCRYATSTGVVYDSMLGTFVQSNATLHTRVITGHVNGGSYNYYVRCRAMQGATNPDDYAITFSVNSAPTVSVSTGGTNTTQAGASGAGGGAGDFFGGSQNLYLASVSITGFTAPLGTYHVLKDGAEFKTGPIPETGRFEALVSNLERGAYTFSIFSRDRKGRKSATVTQTLSVGQGTSNNLSNILIPPTLELDRATVELNQSVGVSGEGAPGGTVEIFVIPKGSAITLGGAQKYIATTSAGVGTGAGLWRATISTAGLSRGTYEVKARTLANQAESAYSGTSFLGVGESPTPEFGSRADINGDGKVNLTDFSIMLSFWGTGNDTADINQDGTINLSDFSILLFNWTG